MSKGLAFFLGMIFGVIFFFAALFGAGYIMYTATSPSDYGGTETILGDLNQKKIKEIVDILIDLGQNPTDEKASLGQFCDKYKVDIKGMLGLDDNLWNSISQIPVFALFGPGGTDALLNGTPLSLLGNFVTMFSGEDFCGFNKHNVGELLTPGGIGNVLSSIRIGSLLGYPLDKVQDTTTYSKQVVSSCSNADGNLWQVKKDDSEHYIMQLQSDGGWYKVSAPKCGNTTDTAGAVSLATTTAHIHAQDCFDILWATSASGAQTKGLMAVLSNFSIGGFFEQGFDPIAKLGPTQIGSLIGYEYNATEDVWYNGATPATGLFATLAGIKISDIMTGNPMDALGDVQIGGLLGYTYNETEKIWYNGATPATGLLATLADIKVSALTGSDPMGALNNIKLGELLGYTYNETEKVWYNGSIKVTGLFASVSGLTVGQLMKDPMAELSKFKLGELLGYTEKVDGWYDSNNNLVTGLFATFANITIDQLMKDPMGAVKDTKLGTLLDYTEKTDGWYDNTGKKVTGLFATFAGITIGELTTDPMSAISTVKFGALLNYTLKDGVWLDASGNTVSGIFATLADLTFGDITAPGFTFDSLLNGLYIGDVLGNKLVEVKDTALYDTKYLVSESKVNDNGTPADPTDDKTELVWAIRRTTAQPYKYIKSKDGTSWYDSTYDCIDTTIHTADTLHTDKCFPYKWLDKNNLPVSGMQLALSNAKLSDMTNPIGALSNIYIGELLGYTQDEVDKDIWYTDSTKKIKVEGINLSLAKTKIGDLKDFKVETLIDYLGTILGYKRVEMPATDYTKDVANDGKIFVKSNADGSKYIMSDNNKTWYEAKLDCINKTHINNVPHTVDCFKFTWKDGNGYVGTMYSALANLRYKDLSTLDINKIFGNISLGELMGYYKNAEGKWFKDSALSISVGTVESKIASLSYSQLTSGFDINTILGDIQLGDLMSYTKDANGNWKNSSGVEIKGIEKKIADLTYKDLTSGLNFTTLLQGLKVGEAMNYVYNADASKGDIGWYKSATISPANKVNNLTASIANIDMGNLLAGTVNFDTIINSLTLRDVLGAQVDSNTVLKSIADKKISELSSALDSVYLGDIFGYYKRSVNKADYPTLVLSDTTNKLYLQKNASGNFAMSEDNINWYEARCVCSTTTSPHTHIRGCYSFVWYKTKECLAEADGINGKLSDLTISGMTKDGALMNVINTMTLSDVLGASNCTGILASLKDKKVGELSTVINDMYLGEVFGYTREKITNTSGYIVDIANKLQHNGADYIKSLDNGVTWYKAGLICKDSTHIHDETCYNIWKNGTTWADGINGKLSNITINGMNKGTVLSDTINDMTLSDVLGASNCTGMLSSLKDKKIGELSTAINGMYLGEVFGYTREKITNTSGYIVDIANKLQHSGLNYIKSLDNGVTWYKAGLICKDSTHIHDETCYTIWKNGATWADGVNGKLSNITIDGMSKGTALSSTINSMTISEVLGDSANSGILANLKDTKIKDLSTAMDDLYFGQLLNYSRKEITDISTYTTEVMNTATLTVKSSASNKYIMSENSGKNWYEAKLFCKETVGVSHSHNRDCFTYIWYTSDRYEKITDGVNGAMSDIKLRNIQSGMKTAIGRMTILDFESSGILTFNETTKINLDKLFCQHKTPNPMGGTYPAIPEKAPHTDTDKNGVSDCREYWESLSISNFISELIAKISI